MASLLAFALALLPATAGASPPNAAWAYATDVWPNKVKLHARINPEGLETTYHFEWGPTIAYGNSTPTPDVELGSGVGIVDNTQSISGLSPNTTYHYRIVTQNADGTSLGRDFSLTTPPATQPAGGLPDDRAYELVSPVAKNGNDIGVNPWRTHAAADGSAVSYISHGVFGDAGGTSIGTEYLSQRGPDGWTTHSLTPNQPASFALPGYANQTRYMGDFSADLTKGIIFARTPLTNAPNVAISNNLYLRNNLRADAGPNPGLGANYQLLTDSVNPLTVDETGYAAYQAPLRLSDANPSLTHVIFESVNNLTANASGEGPKAYEWDNGELRLAGILPDGTPAPESVPGAGQGTARGDSGEPVGSGLGHLNWNVVSDDGSRVIFTGPPYSDQGPGIGWVASGNIYMREKHTITFKVNESERSTPDPNGVQPATYVGASTDGSRIFFLTKEALVDSDTNSSGTCVSTPTNQGCTDLYMYQPDQPAGERLSVISTGNSQGGGVGGVAGFSDDGSYVYFASNASLVAGQPTLSGSTYEGGDARSDYSMYVWHNGAVRFVGNVNSYWADDLLPTGQFPYHDSRVTPDGRTLVYADNVLNPPFLNVSSPSCQGQLSHACIQIYAYSYDKDRLFCASCDPHGSAPLPGAEESNGGASLRDDANAELTGGPENWHLNHALSDDGRFVFFTTKDALVAEDTNGRRDVYEYDLLTERVHLLSTGECNCDSVFAEASSDGRTVFIETRQQLVRIDRDSAADLYAVRADGGIPSQNAPPRSGCEGDACQAPTVAPNDPTPSSTNFDGPGNQVQRHRKQNRRRHPAKHHRRKGHRPKRHRGARKTQRAVQHEARRQHLGSGHAG